jgi:hypothetical protein
MEMNMILVEMYTSRESVWSWQGGRKLCREEDFNKNMLANNNTKKYVG